MTKSKDDSRRCFRREDNARKYVLDSLSSEFDFWPEVLAIDADGNNFRIDAVSQCRTTGFLIGWEFKRSHLYMSEFSSTLRQAIRYRLAKIIDKRLPHLESMQLPGIAVFPDWDGRHDEDDIEYGREAEGMRLLAGQFRVGVMREIRQGRLSFIVGQNAIWHQGIGWNKNAEGVLFGKRGFGAIRKFDSSANVVDALAMPEAADISLDIERPGGPPRAADLN